MAEITLKLTQELVLNTSTWNLQGNKDLKQTQHNWLLSMLWKFGIFSKAEKSHTTYSNQSNHE